MIHRVRGRFGSYELCLWHKRRAGVSYLDLRDPGVALAFARSLAHDASALATVRALLARLPIAPRVFDDHEILALLAQWISAGHVWVARRDAPPLTVHGLDDGASEPAPPVSGKLFREKTWIEIELVDMEGKPFPNERYWIQLTDGSIREGRLNEEGRAYFGGLDAGECEVRWPDLDDGAWSPVRRGGQPSPAPKTWIEIELVGMDGAPIPHERYWIRLTDGSIKQGRLNEEGRAYFGGLDAGECEVRWPDLDDGAWSPLHTGGQSAAGRGPSSPSDSASPGESMSPSDSASPGDSVASPAAKTWIEIELVDMDGGPVPHERYRLELPDGTVREGRLDGAGGARVDGIDPGACALTFPALDEGAWRALT